MTAKPETYLINNVEKSFNNGPSVIADISLAIKKGQFVSIIGPSGCGKSTLLKLISGLTKPSSGQIYFPLQTSNIEIGYVFQDPTLLPWATVYQNIELPFRIKKKAAANQKRQVDEMLEMVGLHNYQNYYPRELSGGMRMRVSIARALAQKPDLLLLDEPFAALDEFTREQLNKDLLNLWSEEKWTAVFVTHNIREAVFLSDRVIIMSEMPGRIIADMPVPFARPRSLSLQHQHAFTDFCAKVSSGFLLHE